jgi:hypothetical protein
MGGSEWIKVGRREGSGTGQDGEAVNPKPATRPME